MRMIIPSHIKYTFMVVYVYIMLVIGILYTHGFHVSSGFVIKPERRIFTFIHLFCGLTDLAWTSYSGTHFIYMQVYIYISRSPCFINFWTMYG